MTGIDVPVMPHGHTGEMLWDVMQNAAELAAHGEPTVDDALSRYEQLGNAQGNNDAQVWVSVAFLCERQRKLLTLLER